MAANPDQPPPTIGEARPVVLVLGDFSHEGLTAKAQGLGFEVINRRLRSGPANWQRIADLIHTLLAEGRLSIVFAYIPTTTLLLWAEEQFDAVRPRLLIEIERARGILFIHEDNLQGTIEPLPWEISDADEEMLANLDIPWRTVGDPVQSRTREAWLQDNADQIRRAKKLLAEMAQRELEFGSVS
jgi:hypothetical protein